MDRPSDNDVPKKTPPASSHRRWELSGLLTVMNGIIAAIGSVYVATTSLVVTVLAGVAALLIALMIILQK